MMNKYSFEAPPLGRHSERVAVSPFGAADLVFDNDLSLADVRAVLDLGAHMRQHPDDYRQALAGRMLALLFEKPSLRTRVTFEVAMKSMGGDSIFIDCRGEPLGQREPVCDVARNLDRWVDAIAARTFRHSTVEDLAQWSGVPVVNALSDRCHPCQALADMMTIEGRFGGLSGLKLAYVGDGNNVAHSLLLTATKLGMDVSVATPPKFEPDPAIVALARQSAGGAGVNVTVANDPHEAVAGAHAIYTDVWTSMGFEHEAENRRNCFHPYQVTEKLFQGAHKDAIFMHCLPAHRGEEVDGEILESDRSVVFDQAENRLHAQKALLYLLLAKNAGV
jgi:ornithine carbamoyltransferase